MQGKWVKWALVATGMATVSCSGVVGAGAGLAVVAAAVIGYRCYDRVSVTVTDRVTGQTLCDAKVSFWEGNSEIEATSCYQAPLSAGKYRLHVERAGLVPYDVPIEVTKGDCGQSVQTMYVALERVQAPQLAAPVATTVLPPVNGTVTTTPSATATPSAAAPPASATPPSASDTLLTPSDVARRCQISTKTVLRAIRSGRLPASRLGARAAYRIRPADVEAWLTESQVEAVVVPLRGRVPAPPPEAPAGGRLSVPRTASSR